MFYFVSDNAIINNKLINVMDCSTVVINNDALNKKLATEVGQGTKSYNALFAVTQEDGFKKYLVDNNIDYENVDELYKAIVAYKANFTRSISDIINNEAKEKNQGFSSYTARVDAINYLANVANVIYFNDLFSGRNLIKTYNKLHNRLYEVIVDNFIATARNYYANTNAEVGNTIQAFMSNRSPRSQILGYLSNVINTIPLKNHYNMIMLLQDKNFFNEVANHKQVASIINRLDDTSDDDTIDSDSKDFYETGELNADAVDATDNSLEQLTNTLGVITNYEGHVDEIVKVFLNTVPKLENTTINTTAKGNNRFYRKVNENVGTLEYEDADFLKALLYTKVRNDNFDVFMDSLEEVANNVKGAESLIYIKQYLKENPQFAYKFRMIFNRPIPNKTETYIDSKGNPRTNITNLSAHPADVIFNKLDNAVRNISIPKANKAISQLDKLLEFTKNNITYSNVTEEEFVYKIYKIAKLVIPNITVDAIKQYARSENQTMSNLRKPKLYNKFIDNLVNTLKTSREFNDIKNKYIKATPEERAVFDAQQGSFFRPIQIINLRLFANELNKYLATSVSLNSRNPEGNLQSDVLNRNYVLTFNQILDSEEACRVFAEQKFKSTDYNYSNILIEKVDNNDNLIPGLFRKVGNQYELTSYGKELMRVSFFNGANDRRDYSPYIYKTMTKGDYLMSNFLEFIAAKEESITFNGKDHKVRFANLFLSIPSDAGNQFMFKAPIINMNGLFQDTNNGRAFNVNHPMFASFRNIIYQEILDAYNIYAYIFEASNNPGYAFEFANGAPVISSTYDEKLMYENYEVADYKETVNGKTKTYKGAFHIDETTGQYVLHGRGTRLSELDTEYANLSLYDNLLGNGKVIDILYGQIGDTGIQVVNGQVILNNKQIAAINDAISQYLDSYLTNAYESLKEEFLTYMEAINENAKKVIINKTIIQEFLLNDVIHQRNLDDLFNGKSKYYKNSGDILKRLKEVQGSGAPFGNSNIRVNDTNLATAPKIKFEAAGRQFEVGSSFNAVTVLNTKRAATQETLDRIEAQLKKAGVPEARREELLDAYRGKEKVNDAQSYITFDEFIRRIYIAGEYNKYKNVIEALLSDKPLEEIDFDTLNKIQVQKNFYYTLHYDAARNREVPLQIKNAEYVLIPKLIKGTEFEAIYDAMKAAGIDQLNTIETSKAAKNRLIELWDSSTGELTDAKLQRFIADADKYKEPYQYTYLYRQQEVPSHLKDKENKIGIQVYKKLLDNIPNDTTGRALKQRVFRNIVSNINTSFTNACTLLNIPLDDNDNLQFDEQGNILGLNYERLLKLARENAARNGADKNTLDFLTTDENGNPRYPMYLNSISNKIENLVNGIFNREITRQRMPGWHAAQVADFGFGGWKTTKDTATDDKLAYRKIGKYDGKDVYYAEIKLPRWSKELDDVNIEDVSEDARTMIGYRIPTEGKQSVIIMRVVEFLPDVSDSTVVLPENWVHQSGSDYDVDSVYAMTFGLTKGKDDKVTVYNDKKFHLDAPRGSEESKVGYINYILSNIDKIARRKIRDYVDKAALTKDEIKAQFNAEREKLNADYYEAVKARIDNMYKSVDGIWKSAKNSKNPNVKEDLYKIATTIGNKPKNVKTADYVAVVLTRLYELKMSGSIAETEALDNVQLVFEQLQQEMDAQSDANVEHSQKLSEALQDVFSQAREQQFSKAQKSAREAQMMSYDKWFNANKTDRVDTRNRNNDLLDAFISILHLDSAVEENVGTSNFKVLDEFNKAWRKRVDTASQYVVNPNRVGSHDFLTQLNWHEAASAGRTLKGISVNLDTLASIGNVTRMTAHKSIPVVYSLSELKKYYKDEAAIKARFNAKGEDNVTIDGDKVIIRHNKLGWSTDNKNIHGALITSYTSQTTAYILDVMKADAVRNLNRYTFVAFKTMTIAGIDFDTALSMLYQPIMDKLVRNVNENQGFGVKSGLDPLVTTFVDLAKANGVETSNSINAVISALDTKFGDEIERIYGNRHNPPINIEMNRKRIDNSLSPVEEQIHDYVALKQFYNIRTLGNIINSHLSIMTTDKYGAKQTFYMNNKVFTDINRLINSSNKLYSFNEETGNETGLLESMFPGIENGIEAFAKSDVMQSTYPILANYLQKSTVLSVKVASAFNDTASEQFVQRVNVLGDLTSNGRLTEEQYKDYSAWLVSRSYLANAGYTALTSPITVDYQTGMFGIDKVMTTDDGYAIREMELARIAGIGFNNEAVDNLVINDITNPTQEEINAFNRLTPAQKVIWIQQNFGEDIGIFRHFDVNTFNDNTFRRQGYTGQQIRLNQGNNNIDTIHNDFNVAWSSNNPIIKLALADLVKYAYVLEGNLFRYGAVTRAIPVTVLNAFNQGGLNIADDAKAGMDNWRVTSSTGEASVRLALGYVRQNLDSFRTQFANIGRFIAKNKDKEDALRRSIYYTKDSSKIIINLNNIGEDMTPAEFNELLTYGNLINEDGSPKTVIRITYGGVTRTYTGIYDDGIIIYHPLSRLSTIDVNKTVEKSIIKDNNIYPAIDEVIHNATENKLAKHFDLLMQKMDENDIVTVETNAAVENVIANNDFYENPTPVVVNPGFTGTVNFVARDGYTYIATRMNNEIAAAIITKNDSNSTNYARILREYPNRNIEEDYQLHRVVTHKPTILYSAISDGDPIVDRLKHVNAYIGRRAQNGDKIASSVMRTFHNANLNNIDVNSIAANMPLNAVAVANYIKAVYSELNGRINNFMVDVNGNSIAIDDPSVIEAVIAVKRNIKQVLVNTDFVNNVGAEINISTTPRRGYDNELIAAYNKVVELINNGKINLDNFQAAFKDYINLPASELSELGNNIIGSVQSVIAEVENDTIKNDFFNIINTVNTLRSRFSIFKDLPVTGVDDATIEAINIIKETLTKLENNVAVNKARDNWFVRFYEVTSNNPMLKERMMDIFTNYGDTSFLDLWLQDVHFNRNAIVQTIIKEVDKHLKEAEIKGKNEAVEFASQMKAIKERAAKVGQSVNYNRMIKNGRFVQAYDRKLDEDYLALDKAYTNAVASTQSTTSVEALWAKHKKDKFMAKTTISKFKPMVYLLDENGKIDGVIDADKLTSDEKKQYKAVLDAGITLTYEYALLTMEENMLIKYPDIYSRYKGLLLEQQDILLKTANGQYSEEQNNKLKVIYRKIAYLTSDFTDDNELKPANELSASRALSEYVYNIAKIKEAYFERKAKIGFQEQLEEALNTIERIEVRNDSGELLIDRESLMKNAEYRKAKEWLMNNAIYTIDKEFTKSLNNAYSALKDSRKPGSVFATLVKANNARDAYGIVNGNLFSPEEVASIRKEALFGYNISQRSGLPYAGIIRPVRINDIVYLPEFYNKLKSNRKQPAEEIEDTELINSILKKAWDNKGTFNFRQGAHSLTIQDLNNVLLLLEDLGLVRGKGSKAVAEFIEEECEVVIDEDRFKNDRIDAQSNGAEFYNKWKEIFTNGQDVNGDLIPNTTFYGTIRPKDIDKWKDIKRTNALQFIKKHTRTVTTEYYNEAYRAAQTKGNEEFIKWYKENHVYNPYAHSYEPIRIWTTTEYIDDSGAKVKPKWSPKIHQSENIADEKLLNPDYKSNSRNYKQGSGYDNADFAALNQYEKEAIDLMYKTILKYAYTNNNKYYVNAGYLPSIATTKKFNMAEIGKEALAFMGFSANVPTDLEWKNDNEISFDNDYLMPNPMLRRVVDPNAKKKQQLPRYRDDNNGETQADYIVRRNNARYANLEIDADNEKYNAENIDTDWDKVFDSFIKTSANHDATQSIKHILYAATDALSQHKSYAIRSFGRNLVVDKELSDADHITYKTVSNANTISQLKDYIRRRVFQQYKNSSNPTLLRIASMAQNIAGTKYMTANITGGIANVLTGYTNIGMERLAREYFNEGEYAKGAAIYFGGTISYFAGMYSDKATSLQDGIIKVANIIDYDRINLIESAEGVREALRRFRGSLFAAQSIGEHHMQNSVLFAMMQSHRLVQTNDGEWKIMSKEAYAREGFERALLNVLTDEQIAEYNAAKERIRSSEEERFKANTFKINLVTNFVKTLSKAQQSEFIKERKKIRAEYNKNFANKWDNIYSQFELRDGYVEIKADSALTYNEFAGFVNKVINVNKTIHGVYDKIGAAKLENNLWGGLFTQFHKHLYSGFKKRYRWNAYYDESLDTIQKGAYKSLFDFLTIPFKDAREANKNSEKTNAFIGLQNFLKSFINFAVNFHTNYMLLPENEQANIRRTYADFLWTMAAFAGVVALTALAGGDDDNEEAIWYNLLMYNADRLASEAQEFTLWGAISESDKLWSSPSASFTGVKDAFKVASIMVNAIGDGELLEEYKSGQYANKTKLEIFLLRNTPVVRGINRLIELPNNNNYYKLGQNMIGVFDAKALGEQLRD